MKTQFKKSGISYYLIIIKSYMVFMMIAKKILLAPLEALDVTQFCDANLRIKWLKISQYIYIIFLYLVTPG